MIQGDGDLKQDNVPISETLLAHAAQLARVDTTDALCRTLCELLIEASPNIRYAQLFACEVDNLQAVTPLYAVSRDAPDTAGQLYQQDDGALRNLLRSVVATDAVLALDVSAPDFPESLAQHLQAVGVQSGLVLSFIAPDTDHKIALLILADERDYFHKVRVEPFVALAMLSSALMQQTAQRQRLSDYATFDHLTGLLNRRALAEILEREHVRAERYSRRYSVLFFDLDHFKAINSTYGHSIGDLGLQHVARIAGKALREGDWIGRWGGEEFLCIMPDALDSEAERIAHRLRTQISNQPLIVDGQPIPLTLSIGVACYPQDGLDINSLLVHADAGLADAKRSGRNTVRRYQPQVAPVSKTKD